MIEIIKSEPRTKVVTLEIEKQKIFDAVNLYSYKMAETAVQEPGTADKIASDTEDPLDGPIVARLLTGRVANIKQRLAFCLYDDGVVNPEVGEKVTLVLTLPQSFKSVNVQSGLVYIRDYLAKGVLMDWYNSIGSQMGNAMLPEVTALESSVVRTFRSPGFVQHPSVSYTPSYKSR